METKVKHLVSLAIKDLKHLGLLGKKKKRRKKRAKALQKQEIAKANERTSSEHMVGYSKPSASSQFSNSNNIAIDTQHRVNEAIRQKEELERKLKAEEPTLQSKHNELENQIIDSINYVKDRFDNPPPPHNLNVKLDDASQGFNAQTPTRHISLVQEVGTPAAEKPPLTLGDFKLSDLYALQNSATKGSTSKAATFADDDVDNYIRNQAESLDVDEPKATVVPSTPSKKIGYNEARDLQKAEAVRLYGPLPSGMENSTSKRTIDNWMEEQRKLKERAANKATFDKLANKKKHSNI